MIRTLIFSKYFITFYNIFFLNLWSFCIFQFICVILGFKFMVFDWTLLLDALG